MDQEVSALEEMFDVLNGDPATYCRLCLSDRSNELEELFPDGQGPRLETIDRIARCTGIQISQDEDYRTAVCWMCTLSLEEFHWFRERCRRHDLLIRRKRQELGHEFEVSIMDDQDFEGYSEEQDGPMLRITSVTERFDDGRQSNQSLLEPTTYQPPEPEENAGGDFGEDEEAEEKDVKPDHEMLDAFAQKFRFTNGESGQRSESVATGTTNADDYSDRPYKCAECDKRFRSRANLQQHELVHTTDMPFPCTDCGTGFYRPNLLKNHQERYHSKNSTEHPPMHIKCDFCPRIFSRTGDCKLHMFRTHPDQYKASKTPEQAKRYTPATMVTVPEPKKRRSSSQAATNTPTSTFKCTLCVTELSFPTSNELEDHIEKLHTNRDGVLICLMCPKTFKSRTTLRMHVLNHQGKLPHECKDCGSRFDRMFYLERHRKRYHGINSPPVHLRLRCKFCPRMFMRSKDRQTHTRLVHVKMPKAVKSETISPGPPKTEATPTPPPSRPELSFGCLQCGKDFPSASILREHIEDQHTKKPVFYEVKPIIIKTEPGTEEDRPTPVPKKMPRKLKPKNHAHKCPRCPKTFASVYAMKEHFGIHTGKLKFRCEICPAMFHRPNFLRTHVMRHHGQGSSPPTKVLNCPHCSRGFLRIQDVRMHVRYAHGQGYVPEEAATENGANANGDESYEEVSQEDVEIRDVAITLERIPEDVLQTLDISYGDDDEAEEEEPTEENGDGDGDGASSKPVVPRMKINLHRCPQCHSVFKSRQTLHNHMVYHQTQLPFSCDECGVQFARKHSLQAHKERYHSEDAPFIGERFSCNYCPRIFLRERDKVFHQRNVHIMERTYGTREEEGTPELKKPKIKKKRKDYVCVVCCERFEGEKSCQRHINQSHPVESQPSPTEKTPSESPAPDTPNVEPDSAEPTTEDAKPSVPTSPVVAPLTTGTTQVRPYKLCRCPTCTAIFKNRDNWLAHVNEHAKNVRPHHCEPCLIKRKAGRSNRKVTSVGFKCSHCPKVFNKSATLRNHQRLHNSELRFPCDECGMKYDRFRLLQAHKEKYHSEDSVQQPPLETFPCELCERMFMRLRDRKHHMEMVHGHEGS